MAGCSAWVATSGSDTAVAYEVQVVGNVAAGCDYLAGLNDDPVCKHCAAFYLHVDALDPEPPAPAAPVISFRCRGTDAGCPVCFGSGLATLDRQAAALVAAALTAALAQRTCIASRRPAQG